MNDLENRESPNSIKEKYSLNYENFAIAMENFNDNYDGKINLNLLSNFEEIGKGYKIIHAVKAGEKNNFRLKIG
ncbi:MAG: hypothetical protein GY861_07870 [bacterium]|nr:hypothetical protein [bacterium]